MKSTLVVMATLLALVAGLLSLAQAPASAQSSTDDPSQLAAGEAVFTTNCAGCHGVDGTGSNTGRPLIGIAAEQPDRAVHIMSVTDGKGFMPAWGDMLSAEEIDAAVSYVRLTFVAPPPAEEEPPAADDSAADAEPAAETELAVTGVESYQLAIIGMALLGAGTMLVLPARRRD